MIAIDTNVLLRYLLDDDPGQSPRASALLRRHRSVLVTDVVLAETVWTLRGARYGLDNQGISDVLNALFAEPGISFEDDEVVWKAAADFAGASNATLARKGTRWGQVGLPTR
jgi:predicted nucleic-acid-binding protein